MDINKNDPILIKNLPEIPSKNDIMAQWVSDAKILERALPEFDFAAALENSTFRNILSAGGTVYDAYRILVASPPVTQKRVMPPRLLINHPNSLAAKVSQLLRTLKVPVYISGYRYLESAIIMVLNDRSVLSYITKELYPDLAKMYRTSSMKVARAIRYAIEISWQRASPDIINDIFGNAYSAGSRRPHNAYYIAAVAEYICIEKNSSKS